MRQDGKEAMTFNPNVLMFWGLGAGIGYLYDGTHGAVVGLVGTLACSFLVGLLQAMS
jgi:hypothetical protein